MAEATSSDVAARWRPLSDAETDVAGVLLEDVETILKNRIDDFDDRIDDTTWQALVVQVETAAVLRVLRNPDGKIQEAIDDYRYTRDDSVSTGALYVTSDEWDLLLGVATSGTAFTIRPYGEAPE